MQSVNKIEGFTPRSGGESKFKPKFGNSFTNEI